MKDNHINWPLEFSYQYIVEYEEKQDGHYWECVDKNEWKLIKKDGKVDSFVSRLVIIEEILKKIFPEDDIRNKISKEWELFNWLKGGEDKKQCPSDLSVLLNTVISKELADQEFEVLTSICNGPATTNIRKLPPYVPCWFFFTYKVEHYCADILLALSDQQLENLKETVDETNFIDEIRYLRSFIKYKIIKTECNEEHKLRMEIQCSGKIVKYMRGQVCGCLPIPGRPQNKISASPYCVNEINFNNEEKKFIKNHIVIKEIFEKNGISLDGSIPLTTEQLIDVFNKLIYIPNLTRLIDENKGMSDAKQGIANTETILKNKQKMLKIFPRSLDKSEKKINEERYEPDVVETPEVIVRSPVVANALKQLSCIWQDTFSRTVLISAPPGSGKEQFSQSIPYGNGRPITETNFKIISMADGNSDILQNRLYGEGLDKEKKPNGLIAQAEGGAIFLDEIHQPGPAQEQSTTRSSLLRTLEAGEYFAAGEFTPRKINNTLFVMATSIPLKGLREYNPRDFWTRMNYAIEIPHPLNTAAFNEDDPNMSELVSKFFNHFWWARIEDYYGMTPVFESPAKGIPIDSKKIIVLWQVHSMTKIMGFKCRNKNNDFNLVPIDEKKSVENYPYRFAEEFNKNLSTQSNIQEVRDFSVRGIRNMVTRLFSIAASNVVRGKEPWKSPEEFLSDIKDSFLEISKVADLSH